MTFVVARVIDGSVRILSDWKVTYDDERMSTPLTGTLKAIALSPDTSVAYSTSNVDTALQSIHAALDSVGGYAADDLALALRSATADDSQEFLVASRSTLHAVKAGVVHSNQSATWLGDHAAFEEYQRLYHQASPPEVPAIEHFTSEYFSTIDKMDIAFAAVLQNARFRPVQGLKIVLTSRSSAGEGFHYLPCSAGFDFQPVTGAGEQSILVPTPASGGGYNYSVLVPEEFGIAAIGAHFLQGEFGALFRPLDEHPVIKLRASTAGEFISLVKLQYGLSLSGFSWGGSLPL
jgi:hypothetical protein